jgi:protein-S-isoprenylcysteine O-methyltransferase Ste14
MSVKLILKATFMTLLMPGAVILVVPYFILPPHRLTDWPNISAFAVLAMITGSVGLIILLNCIWGFAVHGKGTLAPIDPPKVLVVRGFYRHTRNPMYHAVILVLLSEALFFGSLLLLIYAAAVLLFFHVFVILYEEPRLRSQFGESYEEYSRTIPRWGFTVRSLTSRKHPAEL